MEGLSKAVQTEGFEDKVDEWLDWDKNPHTHEEIKSLRDNQGYTRLKELLSTRLVFGTCGIRGRMGAGYSRINDLVVIQTTQGLVSYLETIHSLDDLKKRGVVIGFDARHNSKRFAELTAATFLARAIRVLLFSEVCPTPFVSFCININKCFAGVMITASHHPKQDNGYKVYWENGVQIIPPHDHKVHSHILENLQPWENVWDTASIKNNKLCSDPLVQVSGMYFKHLRRSILRPDVNQASSIKVTYTALHGVCNRFMVEAFKAGSFNPVLTVKEQRDPNPDFPTLETPDPEGERALNLAFKMADDHNSSLILANDPDGDSLCVAEKGHSHDYEDDDYDDDCDDNDEMIWRVFTGDDLGALLGWWALYNYQQRDPSAELKDVYMVGSVVSTKFLLNMAQAEGFNYVDTSIGFKWIGNKSRELLNQGKTVLFGCNGPMGFMMGSTILDKDGILAGMNIAALAAHLETENMTLRDKLIYLYNKYGDHINFNSCLLTKELTTIENVFQRLRNFRGAPNTYPESVDDGHYIVERVRDFTTGYDSLNEHQDAILRDPSVNELITFSFDNGLSLTIRDWGSEPMIKYYMSLPVPPGEVDIWMFKDTLDEMVGAIVDEFFLPEENGFIVVHAS